MQADEDRLLAYRNLLCAEDHLHELISDAEDSESVFALKGMLAQIENIRDEVMPTEADSRYHCLAKHLSLAYEAMREVVKTASRDDSMKPHDIYNRNMLGLLLHECLEKLWGRKIIKCERCTNGRIYAEAGGYLTDRADGGNTGGVNEAVGINRVDELPTSEVPGAGRKKVK